MRKNTQKRVFRELSKYEFPSKVTFSQDANHPLTSASVSRVTGQNFSPKIIGNKPEIRRGGCACVQLFCSACCLHPRGPEEKCCVKVGQSAACVKLVRLCIKRAFQYHTLVRASRHSVETPRTHTHTHIQTRARRNSRRHGNRAGKASFAGKKRQYTKCSKQ